MYRNTEIPWSFKAEVSSATRGDDPEVLSYRLPYLTKQKTAMPIKQTRGASYVRKGSPFCFSIGWLLMLCLLPTAWLFCVPGDQKTWEAPLTGPLGWVQHELEIKGGRVISQPPVATTALWDCGWNRSCQRRTADLGFLHRTAASSGRQLIASPYLPIETIPEALIVARVPNLPLRGPLESKTWAVPQVSQYMNRGRETWAGCCRLCIETAIKTRGYALENW